YDYTYFTFDTPGGNYYVWLNVGGNGVDPAPGGRTKIEVDPGWGLSANAVATAVASAINAQTSDATASAVAGGKVRLTNTATGPGSVDGSAYGYGTATITDGSNGSAMPTGSYFLLNSPSASYYVWYNVDSGGGDPTPGGTGIQVNINSSDTS